MQILKKLLIGLLALVVLLVVVGLLLPGSTHVERSIVISAPQSTVFALVNGFARFNEWSPWAKIDPQTQYTYDGPAQGVGAHQGWQSDHRDVGSGSQTITASEPYSRVESDLDFGPQGTAQAFFDLTPEGDAVNVTWGFDTSFGMNLVGRYFGLMMDGFLGPQYEEGLAGLKSLAESLPRADWSDLAVETTRVEPVPIAYTSGSSSTDAAAIGEALGAAYGQVGAFLGRHRLAPAGQPITINTSWDDAGWTFDAGIPVASAAAAEVAEDSPVKIGKSYGGKVLKVVHTGAYTHLQATYEKIEAYLAAHGLEATGRSWAEWVSDPGETPEEELITHIYFPLG